MRAQRSGSCCASRGALSGDDLSIPRLAPGRTPHHQHFPPPRSSGSCATWRNYTARPLPAAVSAFMGYVPTAVAAGYLRQPEMQLPVPELDFAKRIRLLIAAAAVRPDVPGSLTARSEPLSAEPGPTSLLQRPSPSPRNEWNPRWERPQPAEYATRSPRYRPPGTGRAGD